MEAKLYVILGSHACRVAILMLDHKGIEYETVELPSGLHPFLVRIHGFAGNPERIRPEPPLFPADTDLREAVEEAERWGDEELQMVARRLGMAGALHDRAFMATD